MSAVGSLSQRQFELVVVILKTGHRVKALYDALTNAGPGTFIAL